MAITEDDVDQLAPPSGTGCEECEAAGGWWVHLRRCALCGHIGCCDTSPGQHATRHASESGHQLVQSFEPGEDWFWDYSSDHLYAAGPKLAAPASHPDSQAVPGPQDRVPEDWQSQIHAA
jgi:hypothetical protein